MHASIHPNYVEQFLEVCGDKWRRTEAAAFNRYVQSSEVHFQQSRRCQMM
jgi:hypothetical protein